jgi:hypothetical protein
MHTDKQVYKIFVAPPEWFVSLLESPGSCSFGPFTVKQFNDKRNALVRPPLLEEAR